MPTLTRLKNARIDLPYDAIVRACERYGVAELSVFGSILRPDFDTDSDVDMLVVFLDHDMGPWAGKLADLQAELAMLLRRPVDLVSKPAVEESDNYIRRRQILSTAEPIYVA